MDRLPESFYTRGDVVKISRELLGKRLVTCIGKRLTAGIIVETEAYAGESDRASHAWGGRRTGRTEVMYGRGGHAYVYLCYGIHHLFNVVANRHETPHAILVRALEPVTGIETMLKRCRKKKLDHTLTSGPGNLSKALGITTEYTGEDLVSGSHIWIEDGGKRLPAREIIATTRVGVDYAGNDALLPYRFLVKDNPWVSKARGISAS